MKNHSIHLIFVFLSCFSIFSCVKTDFKDLTIQRTCPILLEIQPSSAKFGEPIELIGENFLLENAADYAISINGVAIDTTTIQWIDTQTIQLVIPKGVGSGLVTVDFREDPCNTNSSVHFEYEFTAVSVETFASNLSRPTGVDVDNGGNVVVADKDNYVVRVYNPKGIETSQIGTLGDGRCHVDPFGTGDRLLLPYDVAFHPTLDIIYIADVGCRSIRLVKSHTPTSEPICIARPVEAFAGNGLTACINQNTSVMDVNFRAPLGLAFVSREHILVADRDCSNIFSVNKELDVVTFETGNMPGNNVSAPLGIDFDTKNQVLFIADTGNARIIQKDSNRNFKILADANNGLAEPADVAFDGQNTVYVVDKQGCKVYGINLLNNSVSTIAGNGVCGLSGSTESLLASFNKPEGIAYDEINHVIYVADTDNDKIQKITLE